MTRVLPSPVRALKITLMVFVLLVVAIAAAFAYLYSRTTLPDPKAAALAQATVLRYAGGSTMAVVGTVNRHDVALDRVSPAMQHAVLAAEDKSFYSAPILDPLRTLKAAVGDLSGKGLQGASTLTQQYVKNVYLNQNRTMWRKVQETILATKLVAQTPRRQIFADYLNTVYFGRNAYGVDAAAHAYFGVPAARLDTAQSALLAGVINAPSYLDPALHPAAAHARWSYVVSRLSADGYLDATHAQRLRFPATLPPRHTAAAHAISGPNGYVVQAVLAELTRDGISRQRIDTGGLQVTTTIDSRMQRAAIAAENRVLPAGPPADPLSALVAEVPGDGAIRVMYGGRDYGGAYPSADVNAATGVARQAGSSFKPYVLAVALERGVSLSDVFDGTSPQTVPGYPTPLHNFSDEQCPRCTLLQATVDSINTVYVPLALRVGPHRVASLAHAAGIPSSVPLHGADGYTAAGIALGIYGVHPIDQATGYATFASGGVAAAPYLVARVTDAAGRTVYLHHSHPHRVMPRKIADEVTQALQEVVRAGTGTAAQLPDGRAAAGKTGTTQAEGDAWFVGYTPSLVAAVWEGYPQPTHTLHDVEGVANVVGGSLPALTWQQFMAAALAGSPVQQFPADATLPSSSPTPPPVATSPGGTSG